MGNRKNKLKKAEEQIDVEVPDTPWLSRRELLRLNRTYIHF